jgi:hypothetical protein
MILYEIFHKSSLENQPYYNLESIFRASKRKEMKASRRLAENDIITRGVTVKIQQVAVRGNYDANGEDELSGL